MAESKGMPWSCETTCEECEQVATCKFACSKQDTCVIRPCPGESGCDHFIRVVPNPK